MFVASSTTQIIFLLREGPVQNKQGSASVMLLQIEHSRTFSFASRIASESAKACSGSTRNKQNASRCAVFCPIPGRRFNSSISRVTEGAKSGMPSHPFRGFRKRRESVLHLGDGAAEI